MNGIQISEHLQKSLSDYLLTIFDVNKDGLEPELASRLRDSFNRTKALYNGPFLEFTLPYKTDITLQELVNSRILTNKLANLSCFNLQKPKPIPLGAPLYTHQSKAIRKLCEEKRSIVISSGTGSGKTECFTIPILNDLLIDSTSGVRALLVYPLNALVNDQLNRLRTLLKDTDITFGRFTSELPNEAERDQNTLPNEIISRKEIREENRIPQILITNYAMLEYLLVRPEDSILFDSGAWKFIVLDEAHTYTGAQGIEVSMLIRRLKQRLGKQKNEMLCIATSATLTSEESKPAAEFASKLFGENIDVDDVIFGEPSDEIFLSGDNLEVPISHEIYLDKRIFKLLDTLRSESYDLDEVAIRMNEIHLIQEKDLAKVDQYKDNPAGFLYDVLHRNHDIFKLQKFLINNQEPTELGQIGKFLFPEFSETDQMKAASILIELGALARPDTDSLPILPSRYHIFARPPQGVWTCINPNCPGKSSEDTAWSQVYSEPREKCEFCGCSVYPLRICRECGQVYIASQFDDLRYEPLADFLLDGLDKQYFTWGIIRENRALGDASEDLENSEDEGEFQYTDQFKQKGIKFCLNCKKEISKCSCENRTESIPLFNLTKKETRKRRGKTFEQWVPIKDLNVCPRCKNRAKKGTEIATPISLQGMAPLANLTYELYRMLPPSSDSQKRNLPGNGRKLLTFYDSRQGAARFAAYLQDVVNRQNYRHLIPKAINQCQEPDEWGSGNLPGLIQLTKKCVELAWDEYFTIQNDPDSEKWRNYYKKLSNSDKREELIRFATQIMGEFTTGIRSRQSLESMGLVGIKYFEDTSNINYKKLSNELSLPLEETKILINYLLDELRYRKVITLPDGVKADHPAFGVNKGHPLVIRQGNKKSWQIRFIGVTERHRIRKYMQLVLQEYDLPNSEEEVKGALNKIWFWLIEEAKILIGSANEGYRIDHKRLFFTDELDWYRCKNCQRLSYRGKSLPCPFPYCGGELEEIEIEQTQESNYFYNLFKSDLVSIRVEEHTAQLDPEKGQEYQKLFYDGKINALSCSTTFELGIDIGNLNAVAMSNVPPSIANYRQRSGRAGRRKSGTAVILTWASNHPHDQVFYRNPKAMISGKVIPPYFSLSNEKIIRRHVNAILLSQFLRYRWKTDSDLNQLRYCKDFFDLEYLENPPHITFLDEWIEKESELIIKTLIDFSSRFSEKFDYLIDDSIQHFKNDLNRVNKQNYQSVVAYYRERIEDCESNLSDNLNSKEANRIYREAQYYRRLLERVRGFQNEGFLINFLSSHGVLPSYSFPLHTIELVLPKEAKSDHLRLERDLRQAIREYAPENEIVADKRIWKSEKPIFWNKTPKILEYRICKNCQYLEISKAPGLPLENKDSCPICGSFYSTKELHKEFVEPDGFLAEDGLGKPARQYVKREPNRMRSGLIPQANLDTEILRDVISLAYNRKGQLLYVNEGKYGNGFSFYIDNVKKTRMSFGFIQETDTLHIGFENNLNFSVPSYENRSTWLSLMYAVIHGACQALQIERSDIDGVLFPIKQGNTWQQKIVLYDNVPGGAGHVRNIKENIIEVLEKTFNVLNCEDCAEDTSCYRCLKDYNNQYFHDELVRGPSLAFITRVLSYIEPIDENAVSVSLPNNQTWLYRKIKSTKSSIKIAFDQFTYKHPLGNQFTWMDTFQDLLHKDCKVNLFVKSIPDNNIDNISIRNHILLLLDKGLNIYKINEMPKWQILIDENSTQPYAICSKSYPDKKIELSDEFLGDSMLATVNEESIKNIIGEWKKLPRNLLSTNDFNIPPDTKVINIPTTSQRGHSEEDYFKSVFTKPVKKIMIHDPYLDNYERIINRAGSYIKMAYEIGHLEEAIIITKRARYGNEQSEAENALLTKYPNLVRFKHVADHDRWIEVTRNSGEKVRIIIGRGLDFIQPDGSLKRTYIVIQDPYK